MKTVRPRSAVISTDINVVAPKPSPRPGLAPVSTTSNPTIKLGPIATVPLPRAPLRPVDEAADTNVTLRPVAVNIPQADAPGSLKLATVNFPIPKPPTLRRVEVTRSRQPVLAPVAVPSVKDRPSLRPVASSSATNKSSAGLLPLQPVKLVPDLKIRLHAVGIPGLGKDHALRRVEPPQARERTSIRPVSPPPERPVIEPVSLPTGAWNARPFTTLRPVDPPRQACIDPALVEAMRAFGERLERIAREVSAKRGQGAQASQLSHKGEAVPAARDLPPAGNANDALKGEIEAARAFVARVKGKAIHVGIDEEGLVLPGPIYWPGNRLTLRGLSDPAVQAELVRMEQCQADYMRHIHLLLRTTLTDRQLRSGNKAILDALPEEERERARAWTLCRQIDRTALTSAWQAWSALQRARPIRF